MNEEIKVYPIRTFKDYGLAKRNLEELTKKISSLQLDLELDDEETPKLENGIVELKKKLEDQKKHIVEFIKAQANYDSKFLSSNLDYLLKSRVCFQNCQSGFEEKIVCGYRLENISDFSS